MTSPTTTSLDATLMREARDEDPSNLGLAGYAKVLCSAVFVSGHEKEFARAHARRVAVHLMHLPREGPGRAHRRDRLREQDRPGVARDAADKKGEVLRGHRLHCPSGGRRRHLLRACDHRDDVTRPGNDAVADGRPDAGRAPAAGGRPGEATGSRRARLRRAVPGLGVRRFVQGAAGGGEVRTLGVGNNSSRELVHGQEPHGHSHRPAHERRALRPGRPGARSRVADGGRPAGTDPNLGSAAHVQRPPVHPERGAGGEAGRAEGDPRRLSGSHLRLHWRNERVPLRDRAGRSSTSRTRLGGTGIPTR